MNRRSLDLDDPSTYQDVLDGVFTQEVLSRLIDDYTQSRELFDKIASDSCDWYPDDPDRHFVESLQNEVKKVLLNKYSYIVAYHSSRVVNQDKYLNTGIKIASKDFLHNLVKGIVELGDDVERALCTADETYQTYHNTISMYISAEYAGIDYLKNGSLYLRKVASNLPNGKGDKISDFIKSGDPVFIKCKVLMQWLLDSRYVGAPRSPQLLYIAAILRRYIHRISRISKRYEEVEGFILLRSPIPPTDILGIEPASKCWLW